MTVDPRSDAELITAVRGGDSEAYGPLYERHLHAAKRAAACLAGTQAEREDLVADAFTRVLRVLRDGGGPTEEFRAYLLVTMRNAAISGSRGATVSLYADVPETYLPRQGGDPVLSRFDADAAASAFASLPERWRTVLWHTEVEDESPAEIAPLLGLRPNGVAALAYRAREGLRQAYLRAHLPEVEGRECRATVSKLAGWVRSSVPDPLGRKISRHLARCADCRARADTLAKVNAELRSSVAPLLLGASLAAAYLPAAAPATVAKTLVAKAAALLVIAATAVTTVASSPDVAACDPVSAVPGLADPRSATGTVIEGPGPSGRPSPDSPGGPPAVGDVAPAGVEAPAGGIPANDPASGPAATSPGNSDGAGNSDGPGNSGGAGNSGGSGGPGSPGGSAKEDRKAEKQAAKETREEAKAEKKADKAAEKEEKKTTDPGE